MVWNNKQIRTAFSEYAAMVEFPSHCAVVVRA